MNHMLLMAIFLFGFGIFLILRPLDLIYYEDWLMRKMYQLSPLLFYQPKRKLEFDPRKAYKPDGTVAFTKRFVGCAAILAGIALILQLFQ